MGDLMTKWERANKAFDLAISPPKPQPGKVFIGLYERKYALVTKLLKAFETAEDKGTDFENVKKSYKELSAETLVTTSLLNRVGGTDDADIKKPLAALCDTLEDIRTAGKKLTAAAMAKDSHEQAFKERKIDWKAEFSPELVKQVAKVTLDSSEYKKFASSFTSFVKDYEIAPDGKLPVIIWSSLIKGLAKSGYINSKIPKVEGDPNQFIIGVMDSASGKVVREELLAQAMEGLQPFIKHAKRYLDEVALKAKVKKWAFWSGVGAKDAAKKEISGGVVLEGSVGRWFDEVWNFEKLTGGSNSLALWSALSELYAERAAECYNSFNFVGFVGPGSTRDQSVFNKIEQPTFIEIMNAKAKVDAPSIDWFVVDCEKEDDKWVWTKKASAKFSSRSAALKNVKDRYDA